MCSPRWGCGCRRRRPAWSTSTKGSSSSGSTSAGCENEDRTSLTSTPCRPPRRSRRSRIGCGRDLQIDPEPDPERCLYLGRMLPGWANYFRHGVSKTPSPRSTLTRGADRGLASDANTGSVAKFRRRFCFPGPGGSPSTGCVHRRGQRHGDPLPLSRRPDPDPVDPEPQPHRLTSGQHVESPVR